MSSLQPVSVSWNMQCQAQSSPFTSRGCVTLSSVTQTKQTTYSTVILHSPCQADCLAAQFVVWKREFGGLERKNTAASCCECGRLLTCMGFFWRNLPAYWQQPTMAINLLWATSYLVRSYFSTLSTSEMWRIARPVRGTGGSPIVKEFPSLFPAFWWRLKVHCVVLEMKFKAAVSDIFLCCLIVLNRSVFQP